MRPCVVGALCGALLIASDARASVLDIFGFHPRGSAMVNAQTAIADDFTAAFYNPGALARRKRIVAGAGFVAGFSQLTIDRELTDSAFPERVPDDFAGLTIGALFPLGEALDNRIALGLGLYVPVAQLAEGDISDGRIPQFYRYQNLPDKFVVAAGLSTELTEWLSIGGGIQVLAGLAGGVDFTVFLADRAVREQSVEVEVALTAAGTAGVHLAPLDGLEIGLSWRQAIALDYALPSRIVIDDLVSVALDLRGTVLYTPESYNLGVAYDFAAIGLLVSGELSYIRWSAAPDPSIEIALDLEGQLLDGIGLDDRLDIGSGAPVDLQFRDVGVWRLGLEYRVDETLVVRGGYAWRPSPAPVPDGAFNYIDGDAHIVGSGLGITFNNPLEEQGNPAHIDLAWQGTIMQETVVTKRAAGDPVGDYRAGGLVHTIGLAFRHDL